MVRASWYDQEPDTYRTGAPIFGRWSSVVTLLLLINIAVFVLYEILKSFESFEYSDTMVEYLGLNCAFFTTWAAPLFLYQFITYQFIHGGLFHILINMLILFFFGRELERHLGRRRFLFLYLAGGVTGGVVQIIVGLLRNTSELPPVIGASGAVYGIIVYYALMWPNRTVSMFIFPLIVPLKVKYLALMFVGISVLYGFFPDQGDPVAHMCHLGGALFGFLFFRYEGRYRIVISTAKKAQEQKEVQRIHEAEQEMDRLLEKIHQGGIHSLTDKERKFLNEASRKYRKPR